MTTGAARPGYGGRRMRTWSPLEIAIGVVTSVGLHLVLAGLIIVGTMLGDRATEDRVDEQDMEFEEVEMLALGEKKPDHQLPEISNPAPPEPEQETVTPDQENPEPEPEPPDKPKEQTRDEVEPAETPPEKRPDPETETRQQQMENALDSLNNPNRPTNEVTPEGSPEGVAGGEATDPELASKKRTYLSKVRDTIVDRWLVPTTISDEQLQTLAGSVTVQVRLRDDGSIRSYQFKQESSNEQFNSSIERALRQFQPSGGGNTLPLPDDETLKKQVLERALNLKNWDPTEGR